jgi:hypothetical protein
VGEVLGTIREPVSLIPQALGENALLVAEAFAEADWRELEWRRACNEAASETSSEREPLQQERSTSVWNFLEPHECAAVSQTCRKSWNIVASSTPLGDLWQELDEEEHQHEEGLVSEMGKSGGVA